MKIVVKVGTQSILSPSGLIRSRVLSNIVHQIASLHETRVHIVLVSSGAVGTGRRITREVFGREYGTSLAEKQLLASLGQHELIHNYSLLFKKYHILSAQLLLTKQDFHTRQHYLNIARLLHEIFRHNNIIPIVNENDSVSIEELMFTDNDELAGLIAAQINADKLIILTSVDGVYDGDPSNPGSKVIPIIYPQDKHHHVSSVKTAHGRGGMVSKLSTAQKMSTLGICTHIAHIDEPDVITRLAQGQSLGTTILPVKKKSSAKRWIAFSCTKNNGAIHINSCLAQILATQSKIASILPIGIEKCSGEFKKGDLVDIFAPNGSKMGIGIAKYGSAKLSEYLGHKNKPIFIHYDHLYIEHSTLKTS